MFKIIVKNNGKRAVVDYDGEEGGVVIGNLRYAVGECMRVEKMTTSTLAASVGSQANLILRFLRSDPNLNGELPKRICQSLNLDESDYHPGYFESGGLPESIGK